MTFSYRPEIHIVFRMNSREVILEHCQNALVAYRNGMKEKSKAFGLVFGTVSDQVITVDNCFPLQKNLRSEAPYKKYMDKMMAEHAIPSQTPLDQRGWVADPAELFTRIKECRKSNQILLGTYHMHRVGWEHDTRRDTPTTLDAVLARKSEMVMFIVSMVDPKRPILRAFFEGIEEQEIPIQ